MSRSEFRWNKKRKHYAYLFKDKGDYRKNLLLSSKPIMIEKKHKKNRIKTRITINIALHHHPNILKNDKFYVIPIVYIDNKDSFDVVVLKTWTFDKNDKRKIKRLKNIEKPATTPHER